jgi:uncharacterized membrane protein
MIRDQQMNTRVRAIAVALAVVGVGILAYALLTPQPQSTTDTTDHMGMGVDHMSYSSGNVGLIALSSAMIVIALMIAALWQGYEPLPPALMPPVVSEHSHVQVAANAPVTETPVEAPPPDRELNKDEVMAREYLVLRLLTGDERAMYKAIMDSGGEALQKDLITRTKMSNAKVSRLLDRLGQKGVITKERYGATNKVKIKPD